MRKDTIKINSKNCKIIAHRGLSGLEKENTAASFIAAGIKGYFGCECDIHLTLDKVFMVSHDANLERVSGEDIDINKTNLEELKKVELIDNFEKEKKSYLRVLEFNDYLNICKKYGMKCIIEYKDDFTKDEVIRAIEICKEHDYLDNCIFISFIRNTLIYTREYLKDAEIELLVSTLTDDDIDLCLKYNLGLDAHYKCITKDVIDIYHKNNLKVNAWTVNDKEQADALIDLGIDYITSDILEDVGECK